MRHRVAVVPCARTSIRLAASGPLAEPERSERRPCYVRPVVVAPVSAGDHCGNIRGFFIDGDGDGGEEITDECSQSQCALRDGGSPPPPTSGAARTTPAALWWLLPLLVALRHFGELIFSFGIDLHKRGGFRESRGEQEQARPNQRREHSQLPLTLVGQWLSHLGASRGTLRDRRQALWRLLHKQRVLKGAYDHISSDWRSSGRPSDHRSIRLWRGLGRATDSLRMQAGVEQGELAQAGVDGETLRQALGVASRAVVFWRQLTEGLIFHGELERREDDPFRPLAPESQERERATSERGRHLLPLTLVEQWLASAGGGLTVLRDRRQALWRLLHKQRVLKGAHTHIGALWQSPIRDIRLWGDIGRTVDSLRAQAGAERGDLAQIGEDRERLQQALGLFSRAALSWRHLAESLIFHGELECREDDPFRPLAPESQERPYTPTPCAGTPTRDPPRPSSKAGRLPGRSNG